MNKKFILVLLCFVCLTVLASCADGGLFDKTIIVKGDLSTKFTVPSKAKTLESFAVTHPHSYDDKYTLADNGLDVETPYIIWENEIHGDVYDLFFDSACTRQICADNARAFIIKKTLIVYAKLSEPQGN